MFKNQTLWTSVIVSNFNPAFIIEYHQLVVAPSFASYIDWKELTMDSDAYIDLM